MNRHLGPALVLLSVASLAERALAQLQMQEQTIGAPSRPAAMPPDPTAAVPGPSEAAPPPQPPPPPDSIQAHTIKVHTIPIGPDGQPQPEPSSEDESSKPSVARPGPKPSGRAATSDAARCEARAKQHHLHADKAACSGS